MAAFESFRELTKVLRFFSLPLTFLNPSSHEMSVQRRNLRRLGCYDFAKKVTVAAANNLQHRHLASEKKIHYGHTGQAVRVMKMLAGPAFRHLEERKLSMRSGVPFFQWSSWKHLPNGE